METALLRVVNDLLQASDDGHVSILSLLNLSAAFDPTDHVFLSQRLSSTFGCTGTVLGWFESYLSNHMQSVLVNDVQSVPLTLKYGVTGSNPWTHSVHHVYPNTGLCYPAVRYHLPFFFSFFFLLMICS